MFLGTAFGGQAPYTVRWESTAGEVLDPSNDTAVIDTTGVAPGTYTATITVVDQDYASDTDTVQFVVAGGDAGEQVSLLDETVEDTEPGVFATDAAYEWTFEVDQPLASLQATLTWDVPANDYDLSVLDPEGNEALSSGNAPPETTETDSIADPMPGTWTFRAVRYSTVSEPTLHAVVTGVTDAGGAVDPRPAVDHHRPLRVRARRGPAAARRRDRGRGPRRPWPGTPTSTAWPTTPPAPTPWWTCRSGATSSPPW